MIKKERPIPYIILLIEALLRRLPENHPKRPQIVEDLGKWWASYRGEQTVDYHLDILSKNNYFILHALRLNDGENYFQMDTLLLSPKFILIIEVKNYSGKIYFDKINHQLIQTKNGIERAFSDPLHQAIRHKIQLNNFMKNQEMPRLIPIEYLVVISNTSTIVASDESYHEVKQYVCKPDYIAIKILELEQKYKKPLCSVETINELSDLLILNHTPLKSDILQTYKITKDELSTRVQCPKCHNFSMEYRKGVWHCPLCHTKSVDAYQQAIKDYFLLFNPSATNADLRSFFHLPSQRKIAYLMQKLHLQTSGIKRGMVYHHPPIQ